MMASPSPTLSGRPGRNGLSDVVQSMAIVDAMCSSQGDLTWDSTSFARQPLAAGDKKNTVYSILHQISMRAAAATQQPLPHLLFERHYESVAHMPRAGDKDSRLKHPSGRDDDRADGKT